MTGFHTSFRLVCVFTSLVLRLQGPGALTRALLALPRDTFDKLIVLEDQPRYLEYLKVTGPLCRPSSRGLNLTPYVVRSRWKR